MIKTKVFLKVLFPYKSFFTKHVLILTVLVLAAARLPIRHLTTSHVSSGEPVRQLGLGLGLRTRTLLGGAKS